MKNSLIIFLLVILALVKLTSFEVMEEKFNCGKIQSLFPSLPSFKGPAVDWAEWFEQMKILNSQVWNSFTKQQQQEFAKDPHGNLTEVKENLETMLDDDKIFSSYNKRSKLINETLFFYYYSLRQLATLTMYRCEPPSMSPPHIKKYPEEEISASVMKPWVEKYLPYMKELLDDIKVSRMGKEQWPIWEMNIAITMVESISEIEGKPEWVINSVIAMNRELVEYYVYDAPRIMTELVIVRRYLNYVHELNLAFPKGKSTFHTPVQHPLNLDHIWSFILSLAVIPLFGVVATFVICNF